MESIYLKLLIFIIFTFIHKITLRFHQIRIENLVLIDIRHGITTPELTVINPNKITFNRNQK